MEAERAAYQEHLRRQKKEKAAENEAVHSDASVAMQAEHRKMQQQERERQAERVEAERRENAESTLLVGSSYGLPPELSSQILDRVGSVLCFCAGPPSSRPPQRFLNVYYLRHRYALRQYLRRWSSQPTRSSDLVHVLCRPSPGS